MAAAKVAIVFNRNMSPYNAGETAGFLPDRAASLVKTGTARYLDRAMNAEQTMPAMVPETSPAVRPAAWPRKQPKVKGEVVLKDEDAPKVEEPAKEPVKPKARERVKG